MSLNVVCGKVEEEMVVKEYNFIFIKLFNIGACKCLQKML